MAVVSAALTDRLPRRFALARVAAWHPEGWVYALAAAAWLFIVLASLGFVGGGHSMADHAGHAGMAGMAGTAQSAGSEGFAASWSAACGGWALMVAAMMLPVVAPQVRTVAVRSLWTRRQRSAVLFAGGYALVWMGVGAVVLAPLVALDAHPLGAGWLVTLLLVGAGWQVSRPRRRLMRRCGSLRLGAATGFRADRNCVAVGIRSGGRCVATCGPLMASMTASHSVLLMVGLLAVMLSERSRGPDPVSRAGRPLEAWVIAGFAVAALATS